MNRNRSKHGRACRQPHGLHHISTPKPPQLLRQVLAHRRGGRKFDSCLASNVGHIPEVANRRDPAIGEIELDEVSGARIARVLEDDEHLAAVEPSRRQAPIEDLVVVREVMLTFSRPLRFSRDTRSSFASSTSIARTPSQSRALNSAA